MRVSMKLLSLIMAMIMFLQTGMPTVYATENESQNTIWAEEQTEVTVAKESVGALLAQAPKFYDMSSAVSYICEQVLAVNKDIYFCLPIAKGEYQYDNVAKLYDEMRRVVEKNTGIEALIIEEIMEYIRIETVKASDEWVVVYISMAKYEDGMTYYKILNETMRNLDLEGKSEYEKARAIHDFICVHVDYDLTEQESSSYSALVKGLSICQGYAELFYDMCIAAELSVLFLGGYAGANKAEAGAHAWNAVKIDGYYYYVDCTWDDPVNAPEGYFSHRYFLKSHDSFSTDHFIQEYSKTPEYFTLYPSGMCDYGVEPSELELQNVELYLNKGESYAVGAYVNGEQVKGNTLTWSSSNSSVAKVDKNGVITAVAESGNCVVTAETASGKQKFISVEVGEREYRLTEDKFRFEKMAESLSTEFNTIRIDLGREVPIFFAFFVEPEDIYVSIIAHVQDGGVVTYDGGELKGVAPGETWIELYVAGASNVRVRQRVVVSDSSAGIKGDSDILVESITLSAERIRLGVGDIYTINANVNPTNATDKEVKWLDGSGDIVKVEGNGHSATIKALAEGTQYVTAEAKDGSGILNFCIVEVGPAGTGTDGQPDNSAGGTPSVPGTGTGESVNVNGLAQAADGNWYKYVNGVIDRSYNGLYCDANVGWWLVIDGKIAFDYTGLYCDSNYGWWLIDGGAVNFGYSGLYGDANYGWWLIDGGAVNFGYSGLYGDANYGWWLVNGGAVNFGYSGLYGDANYGWWLVNGGAVNFGYSGLYGDANYGWWLVNGGAVNFGYSGLYCDANYGWWLVNGGAINFGYTGLYNDAYCGWWYVEGGAINFGYTGIVYYDGVPYNVVNGALML